MQGVDAKHIQMITVEDILTDAIRRESKIQIQYSYYSANEWTPPIMLTHNLKNLILATGSVRKIRLEIEI